MVSGQVCNTTGTASGSGSGPCTCNTGWTGQYCNSFQCGNPSNPCGGAGGTCTTVWNAFQSVGFSDSPSASYPCTTYFDCTPESGVPVNEYCFDLTGVCAGYVITCPTSFGYYHPELCWNPATSAGNCATPYTSITNCPATYQCSCNPYYSGPFCETHTCEPNQCNGHGTCANDTCTCDKYYSGKTCDTTLCGSITSTQCNGHGSCNITNGLCACNDGWSGSQCATQVCSTVGTATGAGTTGPCICKTGYNGTYCDTYVCGSDPTHPCNGEGLCITSEPYGYECQCYPTWAGSWCTSRICSMNGTIPSQAGTTAYPCTCNPGYVGPYCDGYMCGSNSSNPCSGHGTCGIYMNGSSTDRHNNPGVCTYEEGGAPNCWASAYDGHTVCGTEICYSSIETAPYWYDCTITGYDRPDLCIGLESICVADQIPFICPSLYMCTCENGYFGATCQNKLVCNAQGTLRTLSNGTCICKPHFHGSDCSTTECGTPTSSSGSICSGHGTCNVNGTCTCNQFWTGAVCDTSIGCSDTGGLYYNYTTSQCVCKPGYIPPYCCSFADGDMSRGPCDFGGNRRCASGRYRW
jgi:hypothetical protein